MNAKLFGFALGLLMVVGRPLFAQLPSDNTTVTFGNRISLPTIISALQNGGYQALPAQIPPGPLSNLIVGAVTTGVNGAKVLMFLLKCDNSKDDEICAVNYTASFNDDKKIVNDSNISTLNQAAGMAKALVQKRTNGTSGFTVMYNYPCKGFDDTKFVTMVMAAFGADISRVLAAYTAMQTTATVAPPH